MRSLKFKVFVTLCIIGFVGAWVLMTFRSCRAFFTEKIFHELIVEQERVKAKAKLITINHYRPDLTRWREYFIKQRIPDEKFLKESVFYYELIADYMPQDAAVKHLLGLCYYYLGEKQEALRQELAAVKLNPHLFWGWYNLAMMNLEDKRYSEALTDFGHALKVEPKTFIQTTFSSRVFVELLHSDDPHAEYLQFHLQQGYQDALRLSREILRKMRGEETDVSPEALGLRLL